MVRLRISTNAVNRRLRYVRLSPWITTIVAALLLVVAPVASEAQHDEPADFDSEGTCLHAMLRRYIQIVRGGHRDSADTDTIRALERRFADALATIPAAAERGSKLREFRELVGGVS